MHFPEGVRYSFLVFFFYICDIRTCITRRIGLSRSAMSDRVALVKLRSLSIGPLREKYASVRAAGKLQSTLPPLRTRVRACVRMYMHMRFYVGCCLSIINTQSYGRLNAGSPLPPVPEANNYLRHSSRLARFRKPQLTAICVDRSRQNHFA